MQVLASICARSCKSVVRNQSVLVCGRVLVTDLVKDGSLIELGQIGFEVKVAHIMNVGSFLGGPAILISESIQGALRLLLGLRGCRGS